MTDSPDIVVFPLTGIDAAPPRPRNACSSANNWVDVQVHLNVEWHAKEEIKSSDTILIYADEFNMHPALRGDHLHQLLFPPQPQTVDTHWIKPPCSSE